MVIVFHEVTQEFKNLYLKMFYSGVLKGEDGEAASTMQFKPDFENGALLTVVIILIMGKLWSFI